MFRTLLMAAAVALATVLPAAAEPIRSTVDAAALSDAKATPLGLYLTPADAAAAIAADPGIVFVDVRDPIEVSFVGHAEGTDAVVPVELATHRFNDKGGDYAMAANPGFVAEVTALMAREGKGRDDPVFLICRSGNRSAAAGRMLIEAGFTNVWNLVEGFEGDRDKASGHRDTNGWRNAGLPWSYKLAATQAWQPAAGN